MRIQSLWPAREEVIRQIVEISEEDPIVCTTGKASRKLFEIREPLGQRHSHYFLTVGSMGHASSIALGIVPQGELGTIRTKKGPVFLEVKRAIGARDDVDAMR